MHVSVKEKAYIYFYIVFFFFLGEVNWLDVNLSLYMIYKYNYYILSIVLFVSKDTIILSYLLH